MSLWVLANELVRTLGKFIINLAAVQSIIVIICLQRISEGFFGVITVPAPASLTRVG